MIQSALVIVPHPDDEINLAGGLFELLHDSEVYTTVVVCTNGDYIPEDASKRYNEAKKAQKVYKYQELLFLGYGDGYIGKHIYDADADEIVISHSGKKETYCAGTDHEYCYTKTGVHHAYSRNNYKNDIKYVLGEKKADLIICVDLDKHLDHRCVSLLFDECMGELLKSDCNYRPIILKGFAYNGVWFGPYDFFDTLVSPTKIRLNNGESLEKKCFPYLWERRIQIKNSDNVLSFNLWKNPIFRGLLAHKSQSDAYKVGFCALSCFPKIANPDSCYWYRNPYNMALYSRIETTSGEARYLNDFMLVKPAQSISDDLAINSIGWTPDINDNQRIITVTFPRIVCLAEIRLFKNFDSQIDKICVSTENGFVRDYLIGDKNEIIMEIPSVKTDKVNLRILSENKNVTLNEIECYECGYEFPWNELPFNRYVDVVIKRNCLVAKVTDVGYKIFIKFIRVISKTKSIIKKCKR